MSKVYWKAKGEKKVCMSAGYTRDDARVATRDPRTRFICKKRTRRKKQERWGVLLCFALCLDCRKKKKTN